MSAKDHFLDFPVFPAPEFQFRREKCRGENQKKVLLLIPSDQDTEVLQAFLSKILKAAHLDPQKDILLCPVDDGELLHLPSLIRKEPAETVIAFGIAPERLSVQLSVSPYQPIRIGSLRLLFAHSLTDIHEERRQGGKQKAGALWQALQALFLE